MKGIKRQERLSACSVNTTGTGNSKGKTLFCREVKKNPLQFKKYICICIYVYLCYVVIWTGGRKANMPPRLGGSGRSGSVLIKAHSKARSGPAISVLCSIIVAISLFRLLVKSVRVSHWLWEWLDWALKVTCSPTTRLKDLDKADMGRAIFWGTYMSAGHLLQPVLISMRWSRLN